MAKQNFVSEFQKVYREAKLDRSRVRENLKMFNSKEAAVNTVKREVIYDEVNDENYSTVMFRAGVKSMKGSGGTLNKYQLDQYVKCNSVNFKNNFNSEAKQMFIDEVRKTYIESNLPDDVEEILKLF